MAVACVEIFGECLSEEVRLKVDRPFPRRVVDANVILVAVQVDEGGKC